jgi:DNA-binding GntR family transcriptional regulator
MEMSSLRFHTKAELAYHVVRERITKGSLAPGQVLNQEELARTLDVSVTPLREALRRLATEGFVVLSAHRDARVPALTAEEAKNLLELRLPLETLAVRLAADRSTPEQQRTIRALSEELKPLTETATERDLDAHRRFHASFWTAAANAPLGATLDLLWDRADRYRRLSLLEIRGSGAARKEDFEEHFLLRDLVTAGEGEAAAELMRRHVERSLPSLVLNVLEGTADIAEITGGTSSWAPDPSRSVADPRP